MQRRHSSNLMDFGDTMVHLSAKASSALRPQPAVAARLAPSDAQSDAHEPDRYVLLSNREYTQDFRRFLLERLRGRNARFMHLRVLPRVEITVDGVPKGEAGGLTLVQAAKRARRFLEDGRGAVINSVGSAGILPILALKPVLRDHPWIYDVYDDFDYGGTGVRLCRRRLCDWVNRAIADGVCVLAKDLLRRYPTAFHLDNASHLGPLDAVENGPPDRVVIIASFDLRYDYDVIGRVAALVPHVTIDLHGDIWRNTPAVRTRIEALVGEHPNVRFHGPFRFDDLPRILAKHRVGWSPYLPESALTACINPDKYYHYLCAGLEVITSRIPQARHMAGLVHLADTAEEIAAAIAAISNGSTVKNTGNFHEAMDWGDRARAFGRFAGSVRRA